MNATAAVRIDRGERVAFTTAPEPAGPLPIAQLRLMVIMLLFAIVTGVIGIRLIQICLFSGDGSKGGLAALSPARRDL